MIFMAYTALLIIIAYQLSYAQPDTPAELTYTKLVPERGSVNARFGVSVAAQSDFIAVGACGPSSGALYLFHTKDGSLAEILRPDGLSPIGQFGVSVIPRGRDFFVGAFTDHVTAHSSGSVFAVAPSSNTNHKFLPTDGAQFDEFGLSIAASDELLIVGAHRHAHHNLKTGTAYAFDAESQEQVYEFIPPDGKRDMHYGRAVAANGTTIAIGAPLARKVYLYDANSFEHTATIEALDPNTSLYFGFSLAIDKNTLAVGAPADNENGENAGAVFLFHLDNTDHITKVLPPDGDEGDQFGWSVALFGDHLFIGAPKDEANGPESGSAYHFRTDNASFVRKIVPSDGSRGDCFGWSVAITQDLVVIGAPRDTDGNASGSAYVYPLRSIEQDAPAPE